MNSKRNILIIGGGHGSSVILSGLKDKEVNLSAVISMADDGGSTGRLRRELGVSALGDIRNCLAALCPSNDMRDLFSYRFSNKQLEGHSLGNLFLAAGEITFGNLQESIDYARQALGVKAGIYPVTLDNAQLKYSANSQAITGMHRIAKTEIEREPKLTLVPAAALSGQSEKAIREADLIVIAPGNFYCSIAQVLLTGGMSAALKNTPAKKIMVINLVNVRRHTEGFTPADYLLEFNRLLGADVINQVIYNIESIDPNHLNNDESPVAIKFSQKEFPRTVFTGEKILDNKPAKIDPNDKIAYIRSKVRHDKQKIAEIILAL